MSESKFERIEFISSPEYLKAVENFRKAEIAYLKVGEELYPLSLRYNKIPLTLFCRFILSEFRTQHTARFLIILIKIYKHFVIFCHMDLEEIAGIDYKICWKIFNVVKRYVSKYQNELKYIICLNEEKRAIDVRRRAEYIAMLSQKLDDLFSDISKKEFHKIEKSLNKIFEGYRYKYRKFFKIEREKEIQKAVGYKLNKRNIEKEKRLDGIFILLTNRYDIEISKVVESYKNLSA